MQVPLYLFNPSYLLSSYAANTDRVQSVSLYIRSATTSAMAVGDIKGSSIRNLSAIETSLVGAALCTS